MQRATVHPSKWTFEWRYIVLLSAFTTFHLPNPLTMKELGYNFKQQW